MSAETSDLTKVDSAVSGVPGSPVEEKKAGHRRASSSVTGVYNILDLGKLPLVDTLRLSTPDAPVVASAS